MLYYGNKTKIAAFETLKRIGVFVPFTKHELFHGRASNADGSKWSVDAWFNSAGNATGNQNVYHVSAISATPDRNVAEDFAKARAIDSGATGATRGGNQIKAEVHKMGCYDPNGVTIDTQFDPDKLSVVDKKEYYRALKILNTFSLFESSPVPFEKRHLALPTKEKVWECKKNAQGYITKDALDEIIKAEQLDDETARHVAASYNTKILLDRSPSYAVRQFTKNTNTVEIEKDKCPINPEVIATWCDINHVVGEVCKVWSATLSRDIGETHLLFDISRINTAEKVKNDKAETEKAFRGLCDLFDHLHPDKAATLNKQLSQSPKALIQWAASVKGFKENFAADAGVWEGFTVGEHTETALRAFEDTYRYRVPDQIVPIANLCLLVHDIGKGEAVKNNDKSNQKEYNVGYAATFMNRLNIDPRFAEIVTAVIGDGQDFTSQYFLRGDKDAITNAREHFKKTLEWNRLSTDNNEVSGLMRLSKIVQNCDSASYTDMAITVTDDKLAYRNAPMFNKSFAPAVGLTKRTADLKGRS